MNKILNEIRFFRGIFSSNINDFYNAVFFVSVSACAELLTIFLISNLIARISGIDIDLIDIDHINNLDFLILSIIVLIVGAWIRIISLKKYTQLAFLIGAHISTKMVKNYLSVDYSEAQKRSTSKIIGDVTIGKNSNIWFLLNSILYPNYC